MLRDQERRQKQEVIRVESPEGRPAHPDVGSKTLGTLLLLTAVFLIIASLVLGFLLGQPIAALAIAAIAMLAFVANPEVWATILRGKERRRIAERREISR